MNILISSVRTKLQITHMWRKDHLHAWSLISYLKIMFADKTAVHIFYFTFLFSFSNSQKSGPEGCTLKPLEKCAHPERFLKPLFQ